MSRDEVRADFEVGSRGHVDSEVVGLQNRLAVEDLVVHLDERVVVVQLVDVSLLLLPQGQREVGALVAALQVLPGVFVDVLCSFLGEHNRHVGLWSSQGLVLPLGFAGQLELDSVLADLDNVSKGVAAGSDALRVVRSSMAIFQLLKSHDDTVKLHVEPH